MKFSIGDKVVLKQTNEEGVVTAYIDDHMMEVSVDGTTFPAHIDELDHPYLKWFTEKKFHQKPKTVVPEQLPVEKPKDRQQKLPKGVYLSFIPEFKIEEMEDVVDNLKVYFINETAKEIQFQYEMVLLNEKVFSHEGKLHPFGHVYLHTFPYVDMNDQPRFNWKVDDLEDADMAPANGQVRIRPQKLFQYINDLLLNNKPSFNIMLFEDFKPHKPIVFDEPGPAKKKKNAAPKKINQPIALSVIDLHIENLTDNTQGMTNADMLILQLSTLKTYLRLAVNARMHRFTIIHGLGKGKLREEVHMILEDTPEVKSYANDWHGRYGYGATEVEFEY